MGTYAINDLRAQLTAATERNHNEFKQAQDRFAWTQAHLDYAGYCLANGLVYLASLALENALSPKPPQAPPKP